MSISNDLANNITDVAAFGTDPAGLLEGQDDPLGLLDGNSIGDPLDLLGTGTADDIEAAEAAQLAALSEAERQEILARQQAQGFFSPFAGVAESAIEQSGFLTDPQAQFDFLQNNPLFQLGLDNANRNTNARGAASGRFDAGDTLTQLTNNAFLQAQPLIADQKGSILDLLGLGQGIATSQANTAIGQGTALSGLAQNAGNVRAAGQAAQSANQQQTTSNLASIAGLIAAFSDSRLKDNAEIIGKENGYDVWRWDWNKIAKDKFDLTGSSYGVMYSDVLEKMKDAISHQGGFGKVNYEMIGVQHG